MRRLFSSYSSQSLIQNYKSHENYKRHEDEKLKEGGINCTSTSGCFLLNLVIILHYQCNNNWPLVAGRLRRELLPWSSNKLIRGRAMGKEADI